MNYLADISKPFAGNGWVGEWSPGIGDPNIISWIIVALYTLSAWQCYRVATLRSNMRSKGERNIWWILVFGLALLGINKQLDLQTALTEFRRILSKQQGWYENRRQVQLFFIFGIAAFTKRDTSRRSKRGHARALQMTTHILNAHVQIGRVFAPRAH